MHPDPQTATPGAAQANGQVKATGQAVGDENLNLPAGIEGATESANEKYREFIVEYAGELVEETYRAEMGGRARNLTSREVTTSHVVQAAEVLKSSRVVNAVVPRSKASIAVLTFSFASAIGTGAVASYLNSTLQWVAFIGLFVISLASNVYVLWRRL